MYKLTNDAETVLRMDGKISIFKGGEEWEEYQEWLSKGNTPEPAFSLEDLKDRKKAEIKESFLNAPNLGIEISLGYRVDSTRLAKDNMSEVLAHCVENDITSVKIRLYDNSYAVVNQDELKTIINELRQFGLYLYEKKWALEEQINTALNESQLDAISWEE